MKQNIGTTSVARHPISLWLLKTMLLLLGISALLSGTSLILDPSGKGIRFPEGYLDGSPFHSYFIPGVLLTVFIGLLPLAAWFALWKKPRWAFGARINRFSKWHWALTAAFMSGFGLMIWIGVQMLLVPYFFLQPLLLSWGALIVALCFKGDILAFYKMPKSRRQ